MCALFQYNRACSLAIKPELRLYERSKPARLRYILKGSYGVVVGGGPGGDNLAASNPFDEPPGPRRPPGPGILTRTLLGPTYANTLRYLPALLTLNASCDASHEIQRR